MATDPAAPAMITLDRSDGSATIDLYRAALGPVHTDYYLKAFTRFDAAGKSGPSWNWAAALLSLNWMLFRQLWSHALAYVGALTAALLLCFGIGRLVFQLSESSQWALAGIAVLLAFAVPGAWGNAWLYAACNRRMEAALAGVASTEEACTLLGQRASARKHQGALAAGNLALLAAIAGIVLSWPDSSALPLKTSKMEQARLTPAEATPSGLATQNIAAAAYAPLAATVPQATASTAASTPAALTPQGPTPTLTARTSQGLVQVAPATATAAAPAIAPASSPAVSPAVAASAAPSTASALASAPASAAAPPNAAPAQPPKASKAELRARARQDNKEKSAKAKEAKQAQALAQSAAPKASTPATPTSDAFLINVGLFADANNARNAFTKLKDAGLPTTTQALKSNQGQVRTRVRAGPFESQAEAEAAATKIRALGLEAVLFKP